MNPRVRHALKLAWKVISNTLQLIGITVCLAVCWTGATYISKFFYRYAGSPSAYFVQLIDVILGVTLFIVFLSILAMYFRHKELALLAAIIDAMRRISKGDFSVKLEFPTRQSEFQKIVESINEMAGELNRMETMRQDFISNVSHEIQSPLTSIQGFTAALRNSALTADKKDHYLDIIERESRRLSQMSENLLKLSSLESDRSDFETTRFRMDRQWRTVVLASEPQWLAKELQVDLELEAVEVEGVEDLLGQVWVNLLHNSIKFTPDGGRISISLARANDGAAEIIVSDTGIGICEKDLPHLFERFYKADRSRNRSDGGSGLGLSIVKRIVDIHSGDVSVRSVPGQGTSFMVTIPCTWADDPRIAKKG
ncbi:MULTISPECIES: HAMP domain-containing sensor histidine kinase [Paenibacillus]|uniref:sensor histidine kinase n=1 Tax=Paenibacillus TaxID=44249 RepID=UPI002FE2F68F